MTSDPYASGLAPEADHAWVGPMEGAPQLVETFNLWLNDGPRGICINFGPHLRDGQDIAAAASIFLPGGKILRRQMGDPARYDDPRKFGNQYLTYECVEPFRRWIYRLDQVPMIVTSHDEMAHGAMRTDGPTALVSAEIHLTTRSPAWIMGELVPEMKAQLAAMPGLWMGCRLRSGPSPLARRYEQLAEAAGTITVDGETLAFNGTGMRAHVRGERELTGMPGHYWAAAVFPSGKGFAMVGYQEADGRTTYDEGHLWIDGVMHSARVTAAPPMDRNPRSEPFAYDFTTAAHGTVRISGRDTASFVWSQEGWKGIGAEQMKPVYGLIADAPLVMKQSPAAFTWDGETGWGMREISGQLA